MAYEIDATVDPVQSPLGDPVGDGSAPKAGLSELRTRDHAPLPRRHQGDGPIAAERRFCT